jgi:hypothetical protein
MDVCLSTLVRGLEDADSPPSGALCGLWSEGAVDEGGPEGAHGRDGRASASSQRGVFQISVPPENKVWTMKAPCDWSLSVVASASTPGVSDGKSIVIPTRADSGFEMVFRAKDGQMLRG